MSLRTSILVHDSIYLNTYSYINHHPTRVTPANLNSYALIIRDWLLPTADIGDVRFARNKFLGTPEITHLQVMVARIDKNILWLNVSVTNVNSMNVRKRSHHLIRVIFQQDVREIPLLLLVIVSNHFEQRFRNEIHHQVQVDLIRLQTEVARSAVRNKRTYVSQLSKPNNKIEIRKKNWHCCPKSSSNCGV